MLYCFTDMCRKRIHITVIVFKILTDWEWRAVLTICLMKQKMVNFLTNTILTTFHKVCTKPAVNIMQLNLHIFKCHINREHCKLRMDATPKHLYKQLFIYTKKGSIDVLCEFSEQHLYQSFEKLVSKTQLFRKLLKTSQ